MEITQPKLFNRKASMARRIIDYIPFVVLLLLSYLPWKEPFIGFALYSIYWPLLVGIIIWAIIVLLISITKGGKHLKGILVALGLVVISYGLIYLVRIPSYNCDPDKMARHYEKVKGRMDELVYFTRQSLNDSVNVDINSKGDVCKVENGNGTDSSLSPSISTDNAKTIRNLLKKTGCFYLETHFPDYCRLRYKDVGFGAYFYRIYLSPMTEEQKQNVISNDQLIPYSDRVVFEFGGGAVGPQSFDHEYKEYFLKKFGYSL
ncbi:MAG: hypothetical protein IKS79_00180 [Bacteroidales bacterium]|nr:hypothetical protein [Bacteroidales bacterium]